MVLPLNLAMTPPEIAAASVLPERVAWMSCHFSTNTEGITNIPEMLPDGAMLILTDRESCTGHSPDLVVQQLRDAVLRLHCESVLLDFQRPCEPESNSMVKSITDALSCPVAVTEAYAKELTCPVLLAPCPLHIPMYKYLQPWSNRDIWLEAALCEEKITVNKDGTTFTPLYPALPHGNGFRSEQLQCRYYTSISDDNITFTLFDTPETLKQKLETAYSLGASRAVGLFQELGNFLTT